MVRMYGTARGHRLSSQQDAGTTAGSVVFSRLGLAGCMFLLVVTGWLTPALGCAGHAGLGRHHDLNRWHSSHWPGGVIISLSRTMQGGTPSESTSAIRPLIRLPDLTEGLIYTITVTAKDSPIALESPPSSSITVLVPIAQPQMASTSAGTAVSIVVLATDSIPAGTPLTITAVTQGAHGEVTITGTSVTYTPEDSFVGTDSFTIPSPLGRVPAPQRRSLSLSCPARNRRRPGRVQPRRRGRRRAPSLACPARNRRWPGRVHLRRRGGHRAPSLPCPARNCRRPGRVQPAAAGGETPGTVPGPAQPTTTVGRGGSSLDRRGRHRALSASQPHQASRLITVCWWPMPISQTRSPQISPPHGMARRV